MTNKYNTKPPGATSDADLLDAIRWHHFRAVMKQQLSAQPSLVIALARVAIEGTKFDTPENHILLNDLGPAPDSAAIRELRKQYDEGAAAYSRLNGFVPFQSEIAGDLIQVLNEVADEMRRNGCAR